MKTMSSGYLISPFSNQIGKIDGNWNEMNSAVFLFLKGESRRVFEWIRWRWRDV
jgi:hypothetical protein